MAKLIDSANVYDQKIQGIVRVSNLLHLIWIRVTHTPSGQLFFVDIL